MSKGIKRLVLPGDKDYNQARKLSNARFSPEPSAIVFARSTSDVVEATKCALGAGARMSVAGGRHAYQGTTMQDGYLTIDLSNMTKVELIQAPTLAARLGPGLTNTLLATAVGAVAPKGTFAVIGNCPSVGIGGFLLGGGMSLTSRSHGLACDSLLEVEVVLFNGTVVRANKDSHSDVLWASCGGGGGLGVVTEFVVKLHTQPSKALTKATLLAKSDKVLEFQGRLHDWWSGDDLRMAGGGAVATGMQAIFWGTANETAQALVTAGLLTAELLQDYALDEYETYLDMFLEESCSKWVGEARLATMFPGIPNATCSNPAFLNGPFKRMASTPSSPISSGTSSMNRGWVYNTCRLLDFPSLEVYEALAGKYDPACYALMSNMTLAYAKFLDGDKLAYQCVIFPLVNPTVEHFLGGAVAAVPPNATAFFYRTKYSPICFDQALPSGMVNKDGRLMSTFTSPEGYIVQPRLWVSAIMAEVNRRLGALYGVLGRKEASVSYINYQQPPQVDWETAYFGDNAPRLAAIKARYDPLGLFSKPLIVE